jgi:hypothetical protein
MSLVTLTYINEFLYALYPHGVHIGLMLNGLTSQRSPAIIQVRHPGIRCLSCLLLRLD